MEQVDEWVGGWVSGLPEESASYCMKDRGGRVDGWVGWWKEEVGGWVGGWVG